MDGCGRMDGGKKEEGAPQTHTEPWNGRELPSLACTSEDTPTAPGLKKQEVFHNNINHQWVTDPTASIQKDSRQSALTHVTGQLLSVRPILFAPV